METKEKTRRPPAPARRKVPAGTGADAKRKTKPKPRPDTRRRAASVKKPTQDVVYTPPGPFNRNRFLLHLASVIAVVLALLFGMSIFFKVDEKKITVAGMDKYSAAQVTKASGIHGGENILTISHAKISSNIISELPYVDKVRVGIKLPDTVKIEIVELSVVYAVEAEDNSWWLMRSNGGIVDKTTVADAPKYTSVLGVQITDPQIGQKATAYQPVTDETMPDGQPIPTVISASQQLDIAISVLQYMEENGIIGDATSVDVSNPGNIELMYGVNVQTKKERFQIYLGDTTNLSDKIGRVKDTIDELESYDSGILDASQTVQPDPEKRYDVIYTPFEPQN